MHAFLQLALAHESPSLQPEPQHLELRSTEHPAELDRARRQPPCFGRVLVQRNRNVSLMDGEPAVIHSRLEAVDQAVRALQPAVGHCRLASEQKVVCREPGGDPRSRALVAALEVQTVGTLPGVEGELVVVQHVADPAHAFERHWRLALEQGLLEGGSCALPVPVTEGRPALIERGSADRFLNHLAAEYESGSRNPVATARERNASPRLASRVLLGGPGLELKPDDRPIADDPRIVTGLDDVGLAWSDLQLGAVVVDDAHRARLQEAEMAYLTPLAPDDRFDALRPSPSRLQPHARGTHPTHPNDLDRRLVGRAGLVGRAEVAYFHACHLSLLCLEYGRDASDLKRLFPVQTC